MPLMLRRIIDHVLYSNAWIALGAASLCLQTTWLLFGEWRWGALESFVFFATLFLYSGHRLISLLRITAPSRPARFDTIMRLRLPLTAYALLAGAAAAWLFFRLPHNLWWSLFIPSLISIGYVLPFRKGLRLRDVNFLKIFLLATAWSWITAALPAVARHWFLTAPALLIVLERGLFIFAITIPFDIRDLKLDTQAAVQTLPAKLGVPRAKRLAGLALILMLLCSILNYRLDVYSAGTLTALFLSAAAAFALIWYSDRVRHDYYFTGLLDGTMLLQAGLVWLLSAF